MSLDDVCALSAADLSDPEVFRNFAKGLHPDESFLNHTRWSLDPSADIASVIEFVVLEMLPVVYCPDWLERIGGRVCFRVFGVGDFTVVSVNHRCVAMAGAITDLQTGRTCIDFGITPDILLVFGRSLLLGLAEDILEEEDENEDRIIGSAELILNGMPVGAARCAPTDPAQNVGIARYSADISQFHIGDFNGDGLDDFLAFGDEGAGDNVRIHFRNLNSDEFQLHPGGSNFSNSIFDPGEGRIYIGDFNGDGLDDLLRNRFDSRPTGNGQDNIISICFSGGQGRLNEEMTNSHGNSPGLGRAYEFDGSNTVVHTGDFDGDGVSDIFRQEKHLYASSDIENMIRAHHRDTGLARFVTESVDEYGNIVFSQPPDIKDGDDPNSKETDPAIGIQEHDRGLCGIVNTEHAECGHVLIPCGVKSVLMTACAAAYGPCAIHTSTLTTCRN